MTSLPDRPDLDQLRTQAKELKRALAAGEQAALDRVLASHPKYVGRPALLALAYGIVGDGSSLGAFELRADEVVEHPRRHGVAVPSVAPPISTQVIGPYGSWVYCLQEDPRRYRDRPPAETGQ
jgi:hypothetical protein